MPELKLALFLRSSVYWDYAMTIRLEEIVYLHCHQQGKARAGAAGAVITLALAHRDVPVWGWNVSIQLQGRRQELWVVAAL